jgi:hypothetical protein
VLFCILESNHQRGNGSPTGLAHFEKKIFYAALDNISALIGGVVRKNGTEKTALLQIAQHIVADPMSAGLTAQRL